MSALSSTEDHLTIGQATLKKRKKSLETAQRIVDEIVANNLGPGSKLATEPEMIDSYHIGRATLREALRILEHQGVISIRPGPGGGPTVKPLDPHSMSSSMSLLLQRTGGTFQDIMNTRRFLEPEIAALAAGHCHDSLLVDLLTPIKESANNLMKHSSDEKKLVACGDEFHDLVARASGDRIAQVLQVALRKLTVPFVMRLPYTKDRVTKLCASHIAVADAICQRDPDTAREAMRIDIEEAIEHVRNTTPEMFDETIRWFAID